MLCERCKQREASVFLSEVKHKKKMQHYLCEECAQQRSECIEEPSFSYSLQTLLGQFLEAIASKTEQEESKIKCSECGMSYTQFRKQGRFGCEHDYEAFRNMLINVFTHIHGASEHKGKVPLAYRNQRKIDEQIQELRKQMDQAVLEERYEEAASLRDQIRILEGKQDGSQ